MIGDTRKLSPSVEWAEKSTDEEEEFPYSASHVNVALSTKDISF